MGFAQFESVQPCRKCKGQGVTIEKPCRKCKSGKVKGTKHISFELPAGIENGDYVICAISGKKIFIENLTYWNVDEQEPYYSYIEASIKKEKLKTK